MWWLFLILGLAFGKQVDFDLNKGPKRYRFSVSWRALDGSRDHVDFSLPAGRIQQDLKYPTGFPRRKANQYVAERVRAWAARDAPKGVKVLVRVRGGGVQIGVRGRNRKKMKRTLKMAAKVRDEAFDKFIEDNDLFRMRGKVLSYDHAGLVGQYSNQVRPLANALKQGTSSRSEYLERALGFVQAIPYERRKRSGRDAGYRRPLALLARNRGDCDSKAVLYLALVHAVYPDIPASVAYIPGHAFVGLGVEGSGVRFRGDNGVRYLLVEPVGPARVPLGQGGRKSKRRARRGRVQVRPV